MSESKIDDEKSICRWCKNQLNIGAVVCAECGRHQSLSIVRLDIAGFLVSIIMMSIAVYQLLEANADRAEATIALDAARSVQRQALEFNVEIWSQIRDIQESNLFNSMSLSEDPRDFDSALDELSATENRLQEAQQLLQNFLDSSN